MDDREDNLELCEMCERVEVRYVHYMEHPTYPGVLAVGCVCAEHMEQNYSAPRERERLARGLARRRKTWRNRTWRISRQGHPYLNTDGFNLVLLEDAGGWRIAVTNRANAQKRIGKRLFPDEIAVKEAALGALLWAKGHI